MFVSFSNTTTGVTCGAGTANPSGAHECTTGFLAGFVLHDLLLYALWIVVCPFVIFHLVIVLSVLFRFAASDYPFVSLKIKLNLTKQRFALIQL
jgi:hypothetical protein